MFKRRMKARYVRIVLKARALRAPMKLFKWSRSSKKNYDLVSDDEYDPRVPLHPDEAFQYGITFRAKYIGTLRVARPASRAEIVAAMRRVRYEFKAQSVKKRKVTLDISTNGVRVTLRTKRKRKQARRLFRRKRRSNCAREAVELLHHPIYRIFYVSHDSSDLKIFSYIARDGATDEFKCNVFKSSKKSQAMKIVRTVGQAFEVCHKMQGDALDHPAPSTSSAPDATAPPAPPAPPAPLAPQAPSSGCGSCASSGAPPPPLPAPPQQQQRKEAKRTRPAAPHPAGAAAPPPPPDPPESVGEAEALAVPELDDAAPLSTQHRLKLLREKLELQAQQTQLAVSQLRLVKEQLAAEQAARCQAQARTHRLLLHNKELLEHIATLVSHLEEHEKDNVRPVSAQQLTLLPQGGGAGGGAGGGGAGAGAGGRRSDDDDLIDFAGAGAAHDENVANNNVAPAAFGFSPAREEAAELNLVEMTNEQLQEYLVKRFKSLSFLNGNVDPTDDGGRRFYQNSRAFPDIPPMSGDGDGGDSDAASPPAEGARGGRCGAGGGRRALPGPRLELQLRGHLSGFELGRRTALHYAALARRHPEGDRRGRPREADRARESVRQLLRGLRAPRRSHRAHHQRKGAQQERADGGHPRAVDPPHHQVGGRRPGAPPTPPSHHHHTTTPPPHHHTAATPSTRATSFSCTVMCSISCLVVNLYSALHTRALHICNQYHKKKYHIASHHIGRCHDLCF